MNNSQGAQRRFILSGDVALTRAINGRERRQGESGMLHLARPVFLERGRSLDDHRFEDWDT